MRVRFSVLSKYIFLLFLLLPAYTVQPAHAYYWGYSPNTGSSWLWLAQSLFYPFGRTNGLRYNSFYNGAPYYLANSLVWNASYMVSQQAYKGLTNRNIVRQAELQNYQDPEPVYYPRERNRPIYPNYPNYSGQFAYDQVASAGPAGAFPPALSSPLPLSSTPPPSSTPPIAPEIAPVAFKENESLAKQNMPFAQGFIDLVNNKYDSHIGQALRDPQTKSYAKAIGLIDTKADIFANLKEERIELIAKILKDENEDPLTKINTIRILLKH
jgi:hypothetical protein